MLHHSKYDPKDDLANFFTAWLTDSLSSLEPLVDECDVNITNGNNFQNSECKSQDVTTLKTVTSTSSTVQLRQ